MLSPHLPVLEAYTFTLDSSDSSTATTNIVTFDLLFILFYFIGFYLIFTTAAPPIDAALSSTMFDWHLSGFHSLLPICHNASLCVGIKFLNKAENPHPLSDSP